MRIGAIIQARMSSSRLPGKVLTPVYGRPLLEYLRQRLAHCRCVHPVVVATSDRPGDDAIADYCGREGVSCFRGDLENVALRMLQAARRHGLDSFIRICADSPLLDPALVDRLVQVFLRGHVDLATNIQVRTFPKGQSVEVIDTDALARAVDRMTRPEHREHVTRYLYDHSEEFSIVNVSYEADLGDLQMSVDTADDLEQFTRTVGRMTRPHWTYTLEETIELWRQCVAREAPVG